MLIKMKEEQTHKKLFVTMMISVKNLRRKKLSFHFSFAKHNNLAFFWAFSLCEAIKIIK